MSNFIHTILIVDDNEHTNFFHELVFHKVGGVGDVVCLNNGAEAIDYLQKSVTGQQPYPDLIFVDINMPVMNGWEFLEAYEDQFHHDNRNTVIIMLSTSDFRADIDKAGSYKSVTDYKKKPLTESSFKEIVDRHFVSQ